MILDRSAPLGLVLAATLSLAAREPAPDHPESGPNAPQQQEQPQDTAPAQGHHARNRRRKPADDRRRVQPPAIGARKTAHRAAAPARGTQPPKEAEETYELLFRLAINNNLFNEAEPVAQQVIKSGTASPLVSFLAQTIDIIASADRGNFDESLAELRSVIDSQSERNRPAQGAPPVIDTRALLTICEAYYQRLLQGDRFDIAKNAFQLVLKQTENATVKGYCASRLNQLALIGKPAPAIQGTDLDGKPVDLAALKGNVVLIVFWASWCMPSSAEVAWLDQVYTRYAHRGFHILGINVDTLQKERPSSKTSCPTSSMFLIEHNVRWPNLVNGDWQRKIMRRLTASRRFRPTS